MLSDSDTITVVLHIGDMWPRCLLICSWIWAPVQ